MALHQLLHKLRDQTPCSHTCALVAGYYDYADGWNDRALYIRVNYVPRHRLHVELYIDHSKMDPDIEIQVSLGEASARFMSLISSGHAGWPCHGRGIGTLLANSTIVFLQSIYPGHALLTGWAPLMDYPTDEEPDSLRDRRLRFWKRFGVVLDDYNMFDVKIGDLTVVNDGRSCLDYFPRMLPLSAFRYAGITAHTFPLQQETDGKQPRNC